MNHSRLQFLQSCIIRHHVLATSGQRADVQVIIVCDVVVICPCYLPVAHPKLSSPHWYNKWWELDLRICPYLVTNLSIGVCTFVCACMHVFVRACMHVCVYACIRACKLLFVYVYVWGHFIYICNKGILLIRFTLAVTSCVLLQTSRNFE
jgi:hypothetical protein